MKKKKTEEGTEHIASCCGQRHRVFFHTSGKVVFLDHPGVSVAAMATEYVMLTEENKKAAGCLELAACLTSRSQVVQDAPIWLRRFFEAKVDKPVKYRHSLKKVPDDWTKIPFRLRHSKYAIEKAEGILKKLTFRTTATTGHIVKVRPSHHNMRTIVEGTGTSAALDKRHKKTGKKAAIKKSQVVDVCLNTKKWARCVLRGVAVVDGYFVISIDWDKSENEVNVQLVKQSQAYKLLTHKATVRRGTDGIWRVHKWL